MKVDFFLRMNLGLHERSTLCKNKIRFLFEKKKFMVKKFRINNEIYFKFLIIFGSKF